MIKKASVLLACVLLAGALFGCSRSTIPEQVTQRPTAESEQIVTEQADGTREMAIGSGSLHSAITGYAQNAEIHHIVNESTGVNELRIGIVTSKDKLTDAYRDYLNQIKNIVLNCQRQLTDGEYTKVTFTYSKNSKYTGLPLLYTLEMFLTPRDGKYILEREPFDSALKEISNNVGTWQSETEEEPGWVLATLYSIPATVGIYQLAQ